MTRITFKQCTHDTPKPTQHTHAHKNNTTSHSCTQLLRVGEGAPCSFCTVTSNPQTGKITLKQHALITTLQKGGKTHLTASASSIVNTALRTRRRFGDDFPPNAKLISLLGRIRP